jgi:predicted acetyltransferase
MSLEFRPIRDDEVDAYLDVMELACGIEISDVQRPRSRKNMEVSRMRGAIDNGKVVATFNAYPIELTVPGNVIPLSGVSQVTVAPTHRRRGILTKLMTSHFEEARERGDLMAGLWASEGHIYPRYGYGVASYHQAARILKPFAKMNLQSSPDVSIEMVNTAQARDVLPGIYDRARPRIPGMLSRTANWWEFRILADPPQGRQGATPFRHAVLSRAGQPEAYAIYYHRLPNGYGSLELHLVEIIAVNDQAELALWEYLLNIDLTVLISYWNQPVDSIVIPRTIEARRWELSKQDSLWLRPVDLPGSLAARRYSSSGQLAIECQDDQCPWNTGRFLLSVDESGVAACQPTTQDAQLRVTPREIGALYLGGVSAYELWRSGLLHGDEKSVIAADRLFRWHRQPWCPHIF